MDDHPHGYVTITATGLVFADKIPYEAWEAIGVELQRRGGVGLFALGDWINYGERTYGEKFAQAIAVTPYRYGTLANNAYVAKQVEISRRRETLSFSHHAEVAALTPTEQAHFLDWAEQESSTVRELRTKISDRSFLVDKGEQHG